MELIEFFKDSDLDYKPPGYSLDKSPVRDLIGESGSIGNEKLYCCKIHVDMKNVHWQTVEHHIRFSEPEKHLERLLSGQ